MAARPSWDCSGVHDANVLRSLSANECGRPDSRTILKWPGELGGVCRSFYPACVSEDRLNISTSAASDIEAASAMCPIGPGVPDHPFNHSTTWSNSSNRSPESSGPIFSRTFEGGTTCNPGLVESSDALSDKAILSVRDAAVFWRVVEMDDDPDESAVTDGSGHDWTRRSAGKLMAAFPCTSFFPFCCLRRIRKGDPTSTGSDPNCLKKNVVLASAQRTLSARAQAKSKDREPVPDSPPAMSQSMPFRLTSEMSSSSGSQLRNLTFAGVFLKMLTRGYGSRTLPRQPVA